MFNSLFKNKETTMNKTAVVKKEVPLREGILISRLNEAKLKVKIQSLSEESRIIRKIEKGFSGREKYDLQYHRKWDVRNECRSTILALAFLKRKKCSDFEGEGTDIYMRSYYIVPRMIKIIIKYGNTDMGTEGLRNAIGEWINE